MKFNQCTNLAAVRALIVSMVILSFFLISAHIYAGSKIKPSPNLYKPLIGAWKLDGGQDNNSNPSGIGVRLQLYTGKHWVVTQADPKTGEVIFHHGGTYTLKGDELIKTVEYANSSTADLIGQSHKFKITIAGDTLTQFGIGNGWNEIWVRAK